jgi:hypothetical protein
MAEAREITGVDAWGDGDLRFFGLAYASGDLTLPRLVKGFWIGSLPRRLRLSLTDCFFFGGEGGDFLAFVLLETTLVLAGDTESLLEGEEEEGTAFGGEPSPPDPVSDDSGLPMFLTGLFPP